MHRRCYEVTHHRPMILAGCAHNPTNRYHVPSTLSIYACLASAVTRSPLVSDRRLCVLFVGFLDAEMKYPLTIFDWRASALY